MYCSNNDTRVSQQPVWRQKHETTPPPENEDTGYPHPARQLRHQWAALNACMEQDPSCVLTIWSCFSSIAPADEPWERGPDPRFFWPSSARDIPPGRDL